MLPDDCTECSRCGQPVRGMGGGLCEACEVTPDEVAVWLDRSEWEDIATWLEADSRYWSAKQIRDQIGASDDTR